VIDLTEGQELIALDSMNINSESVSNEIDESYLQWKKHPNKEFQYNEKL
jgi:hypothetical protein